MEKNISSYQLEQSDNKKYILTTSIVNDKLKLITQDSNSNTFIGAFSLSDLCNISQYFNDIKSIEQVQNYLNGIIEKQMVEINQTEFSAQIIVHLINTDSIIIPLINKVENNNYNYLNIQNQYMDIYSNPITQTTDNYSNINYDYFTNQIINNNGASEIITQTSKKSNLIINSQIPNDDIKSQKTNIIKNNINKENYMTLDAGYSNMTYNKLNEEKNLNILMDGRAKTPVKINSITNNIKKAHSKIRKEKTNINPKQELISKEIKKLTERVENYINDIDGYKKDKLKLIEDAKRLKKENEKLRAQVKDFQVLIKEYKIQSESLKNQFNAIQNSILSGMENLSVFSDRSFVMI